MQSLVIECAVRASLIVAAVAFLLFILKVKGAATRHAVWAGVVVTMLLLPAWVEWGPKVTLPILPAQVPHREISTPVLDRQFAAPNPLRVPALPPAVARNWSTVLFSAYIVGLSGLLLRLAIGTLRINTLRKDATVRNGRLTHIACAAPVTVGWLHPTVILPVDWCEWPQAQLDAVLIHELEHARRRDPLVQWVALLNRALFWFHPFSWWLERQLSLLAEQACDAAVLIQGHRPGDYSEYLLALARSVTRAGLRIDSPGMAMPGPFLARRLRLVLSHASIPRPSRWRLACTCVACAVMVGTFATGRLVYARPAASAQGQPGLTFEVASVKVNKSDETRVAGGFQPSGVYRVSNYTLRSLIAAAYLRPQINPDFLISGGPKWIDSDHFNVEAKAPGDFAFVQGPESISSPRRVMLQALLAERFQLKVHMESFERPIYVLKLANSNGRQGPQLNKAAECRAGGNTCAPRIGPGLIDLHGTAMAQFANLLPRFVDRIVLDQTGLSGSLDIQLKWTPAPGEWVAPPIPGVALAPLPDGPSIFTALQEQLGLKLEQARGPVEVLVIDHAEQPLEN